MVLFAFKWFLFLKLLSIHTVFSTSMDVNSLYNSIILRCENCSFTSRFWTHSNHSASRIFKILALLLPVLLALWYATRPRAWSIDERSPLQRMLTNRTGRREIASQPVSDNVIVDLKSPKCFIRAIPQRALSFLPFGDKIVCMRVSRAFHRVMTEVDQLWIAYCKNLHLPCAYKERQPYPLYKQIRAYHQLHSLGKIPPLMDLIITSYQSGPVGFSKLHRKDSIHPENTPIENMPAPLVYGRCGSKAIDFYFAIRLKENDRRHSDKATRIILIMKGVSCTIHTNSATFKRMDIEKPAHWFYLIRLINDQPQSEGAPPKGFPLYPMLAT